MTVRRTFKTHGSGGAEAERSDARPQGTPAPRQIGGGAVGPRWRGSRCCSLHAARGQLVRRAREGAAAGPANPVQVGRACCEPGRYCQ